MSDSDHAVEDSTGIVQGDAVGIESVQVSWPSSHEHSAGQPVTMCCFICCAVCFWHLNTENNPPSGVVHSGKVTARQKCLAVAESALGNEFSLIKVERMPSLSPSTSFSVMGNRDSAGWHSGWSVAISVDRLHIYVDRTCQSGHKAADKACTTFNGPVRKTLDSPRWHF